MVLYDWMFDLDIKDHYDLNLAPSVILHVMYDV